MEGLKDKKLECVLCIKIIESLFLVVNWHIHIHKMFEDLAGGKSSSYKISSIL